jgi:hypothetical protein
MIVTGNNPQSSERNIDKEENTSLSPGSEIALNCVESRETHMKVEQLRTEIMS